MIPFSPRSLLAAPALLLLALPSSAQVIPIGPFPGDVGEGFESHIPGAAAFCLESRVFNGVGELCTPGTSGATVVTGWDFFCDLDPHAGPHFYGSAFGMSVFRFGAPIRRFGGYFACNAQAGDVRLRFLDGTGQLVGDELIEVPNDCSWTWHGFETAGGDIRRVEVMHTMNGGAFVMMDSMHIEMGALGARYCEAGTNSTGESAHISAFGSTSIANNNLVLATADQPPMTPGLFYYGGATGQSPFGDGFRCVRSNGTGLQRLPLKVSNLIGVMRTSVDYDALPNPSLQILSGTTWNFQALYRDPSAGGAGFNLTDAIALTFTP